MSDELETERVRAEREEEQADRILDDLDEMLCEGRYSDADAYMAHLPSDTEPGALLSALSLTWHAGSALPSRPAFVERCRIAFVDAFGETRAADLMRYRS